MIKYHRSEETKRKIALTLLGNQNGRGYKHTPEAKKKISNALKGNQYSLGRTPWNRGLKYISAISEEERKKLSTRMKGNKFAEGFRRPIEQHPGWKGGRQILHGYARIRCEGHPRESQRGHYVFEHILVMEKRLGRYLKKGEIVHHINRIKTDNRDENLKLMTRSDHARYHRIHRQ